MSASGYVALQPRDGHLSMKTAASSPDQYDHNNDSYILLPDDSKFLKHWDTFIAFVLVVVCFTTPYDIAFGTRLYLQRVWDCVVDFAFTVDMILQFFTAYPLPRESSTSSLWEQNQLKIAVRYMSPPFSWHGRFFWFDMLSVLPGWIAFIVGDEVFEGFLLLRTFRITKLSRVETLWQYCFLHFGMPFALSECVSFLLITTVVAHWMGCVWCAVEGKITHNPFRLAYPDGAESWLSRLIASKGDSCFPDSYTNNLCVYNIAVYWALMTITSVGYGDIIPQNQVEYVACNALLFVSGFVWAYIVGSVVEILGNLNPEGVLFKQQMDALNEFMENLSLKPELRRRLREYMLGNRYCMRYQNMRAFLVGQFPDGLNREIAKNSSITGTLLEKVYWMREIEQDALLELVNSLTACFYASNQVVLQPRCLIILRTGLAVFSGRFLKRNEVIGLDAVLMESIHLVDSAVARTITAVDLFTLCRSSVARVCDMFPAADATIRRAQIRVALWRGVAMVSKEAIRVSKGGPVGEREWGTVKARVARWSQIDTTTTRTFKMGFSNTSDNIQGHVRDIAIAQSRLEQQLQYLSSMQCRNEASMTDLPSPLTFLRQVKNPPVDLRHLKRVSEGVRGVGGEGVKWIGEGMRGVGEGMKQTKRAMSFVKDKVSP